MGSVNKVLLMGNMTRDPELRYTPDGTPVCDFGLAINRQYQGRDGEKKEEVCFVDITFWRRRGEVVSEYFKKGDPIFVEGRLQLDQWETPDGRRSKLKVIGENFEFVGSASGGAQGSGGRGAGPERGRGRSSATDSPPARAPEDIGEDVSDDEIPF